MSTHSVNFNFIPPDPDGAAQSIGQGDPSMLKLAIVISRFNEPHVLQLLESARASIRDAGVPDAGIRIFWVPGAYEIPVVAEHLAAGGGCDAVLALGCVIEGETPHAQLISESVAHALTDIAVRHGVPVLDGVVSVRSVAQADTRCRRGPEGRGWSVARAAVEMGLLMRRLRDHRS